MFPVAMNISTKEQANITDSYRIIRVQLIPVRGEVHQVGDYFGHSVSLVSAAVRVVALPGRRKLSIYGVTRILSMLSRIRRGSAWSQMEEH